MSRNSFTCMHLLSYCDSMRRNCECTCQQPNVVVPCPGSAGLPPHSSHDNSTSDDVKFAARFLITTSKENFLVLFLQWLCDFIGSAPAFITTCLKGDVRPSYYEWVWDFY